MKKNNQRHEETSHRYHFSPGSGKPKAAPPKKQAEEIPSSKDLESLDSIDEAGHDHKAAKQDNPPPASGVQASDDPGDDTSEGREQRIVCSFPGIMKVLIPEKSFIPIPMAVRVANMSSGGALIEIHDRNRGENILSLPDRFFELKIAHPEIPELRGTIAWTDFSHEQPLIGLSFYERNEVLASHVLISDTHRDVAGPPPLPEIAIDPFPSVTHEETLVLTGKALEASEINVKSDDKKYTAKVKDDQFEVQIELSPDKKNTFTVQSKAGARFSRGVPIQIMFERKTNQQKFTYSVTESTDAEGSNRLNLHFSGNLRQAERMIYRFSQIYSNGERLTLDATVTSRETIDPRLVNALRSEGNLLSADTTKNEVAAKLLDELLF